MEEFSGYSRFEECLILLIAKFFSEEKDIEKFSEWFNKKMTKPQIEVTENCFNCYEPITHEFCEDCNNQ